MGPTPGAGSFTCFGCIAEGMLAELSNLTIALRVRCPTDAGRARPARSPCASVREIQINRFQHPATVRSYGFHAIAHPYRRSFAHRARRLAKFSMYSAHSPCRVAQNASLICWEAAELRQEDWRTKIRPDCLRMQCSTSLESGVRQASASGSSAPET